MKSKGGWEVKCVPVSLAREITRRNIDDRMWFDRAEAKGKWVTVRRPKGEHQLPFQSFALCEAASHGSAAFTIKVRKKRKRNYGR